MVRSTHCFYGIIILMFLGLYSCKVDTNFSKTPHIFEGSYSILKALDGSDSVVVIKFKFTDGDGNVGLTQSDTTPPHNRNLFVDYFEKEQDGVFRKQLIPKSTDTINFNSRIDDLKSVSKTPLEGIVELSINVEISNADTIRFDYYIEDRDFHKSNLISTGPISLK